MATVRPEQLKRCPAPFGGGTCDSAIFYDWGLVVMSEYRYDAGIAGPLTRSEGSVRLDNIKICARCTTPYAIEDGELVDLSSELSAEDVKAILSRGQATLPHVKVKDP